MTFRLGGWPTGWPSHGMPWWQSLQAHDGLGTSLREAGHMLYRTRKETREHRERRDIRKRRIVRKLAYLNAYAVEA